MPKDGELKPIIKNIEGSIFLDQNYKNFLASFVKSMPAKHLGGFKKCLEEISSKQEKFIKKILGRHPDFLAKFNALKRKKVAKNIRSEEQAEKKKADKILEELERN